MEIGGSDFGHIVGVQRQVIYTLRSRDKLTLSESGKYNIYDPKNMAYLKKKGKSALDVENYIKSKPKTLYERNKEKKKKEPVKKNIDESKKLIKIVSNVIQKRYGSEDAAIIKNMIFQEFKASE